MWEKIQKIYNHKWCNYYLVLVGSLLISFFRIDHQSLWLDESISIEWAAKKPLIWIWENVPKTDLHPPVYYSILHFWQSVFGDSVFSIRALSALFFVGSSLLIYYFAKLIFSSDKKALVASLLFITNPFAVLYAQEVRSYSFLIFLILINAIFYYKIVFLKEENKRLYLWYFLTALIFIYTNIISLFVLLAHAIIVLSKKDLNLFKKFLFVYTLLFLAYIPVLKIVQSANKFDYSYYYTEKFNIVMQGVVAIAGFIGARVNVLNGKNHIYGLLAASLALYGLIFLFGLKNIKKLNTYLLYFFGLSLAITLAVTYSKFPVPDPKYFYVAFPSFILLVANILAVIDKKIIRNTILAAVLLVNSVFLYNYFFVKAYERENWKSAVKQVEQNYATEKNKTAVMIAPFSEPYTAWSYYSQDSIPGIGAFKYGNSTTSIERAFSEFNKPAKDIIYLSRFLQPMYDSNDTLKAALESRGYVKTDDFEDTKVIFWRYDRIVTTTPLR